MLGFHSEKSWDRSILLQEIKVTAASTVWSPDTQTAALNPSMDANWVVTEFIAAESSKKRAIYSISTHVWHSSTRIEKVNTERMTVIISNTLGKC